MLPVSLLDILYSTTYFDHCFYSINIISAIITTTKCFSHVVFDPFLVIYVPLVVWLLSDVSYSGESRTKKYFQYAENMFPLFVAILKLCSTKHLFKCFFPWNCLIRNLHIEGLNILRNLNY